jgi:cytochrome P450
MTISTHLYATHHDENLYPHADVFDGFRFIEPASTGDSEKDRVNRENGIKNTMYTTSRSYLAFGHGRQAWYVTPRIRPFLGYALTGHNCSPGRFYAAMQVKLILAYLITNYEMKWPDSVYDPSVPGYTEEGYRPPDVHESHRLTPDVQASMMIRRRASP